MASVELKYVSTGVIFSTKNPRDFLASETGQMFFSIGEDCSFSDLVFILRHYTYMVISVSNEKMFINMGSGERENLDPGIKVFPLAPDFALRRSEIK